MMSKQNGGVVPKDLKSMNKICVSRRVHRLSWGDRKGRNKMPSTNENRWSNEDFQLGAKIGQGHFGNVYCATYNRIEDVVGENTLRTKTRRGISKKDRMNNFNVVAIKCFSKGCTQANGVEGSRTLKLLKREINIHSHLRHDHILEFLGFFENRCGFSLVLEYAHFGDLLHYMIDVPDDNRFALARNLLWQVTQALQYLEMVQVAHRDIKPENILVVIDDGREHPIVKLCDFGWAIWFKPGSCRSTLCGTAEYCPPEMLSDDTPYSAEHVDSWMLGILAIELVDSFTPFAISKATVSKTDHAEHIFRRIRKFSSIESWEDYNSNLEYQNFISSLLRVDPVDRMTSQEALDHCFFSAEKNTRPPLSVIKGPTVAQLRQVFQET